MEARDDIDPAEAATLDPADPNVAADCGDDNPESYVGDQVADDDEVDVAIDAMLAEDEDDPDPADDPHPADPAGV